MITKITSTNFQNQNYNRYHNNQNTSFCGLSDRLGKKIYNGFYKMEDLFPRETTKNPISGKLPTFMKNKIMKVTDDYNKATKEIFDTFAQVSNELREFEPTVSSTIEEIQNKRNNSTVKKLSDVLQKYKIVSPWDDFDLKYIDKGGKGSVWKLDGLRHIDKSNEDEFVIKVFHTKSVQSNAYHGCYPEMNTATYWMKTLGPDTNRGKFFWGDVNEAYMINKFIDEDVRLPKKFPDPYAYGIKFTDEDPVHIHNVCKKYSYDWGGGVVINQVVNSNRFAREIMHNIQNNKPEYRELEWIKRFHWKPNGNYDCKYAGLALAIKFLEPEKRIYYFEKLMQKRGKYTDRALAYTLKYLPYNAGEFYYKRLADTSNDKVLKEILKNEIPLLSFKSKYFNEVKDDLIVMDNILGTDVKEFIDMDRYSSYRKLARECGILN